jgi:DNA-binding response OmpR family regulator
MKKIIHKKILVVDDDPDILDSLRLVLNQEGYDVQTTEKGDYVEKLHDNNGGLPALIILDVLLSGKDGRIICKKLKSRKDTKHIPIIIISAHPDAEVSALKVGANAFLAKPFDLLQLLELIDKFLAKNRI